MTTTPEVEYLRAIIEKLVDDTDKISITRRVDDMGVLLTLQVGRNDIGKVIGKEGENARAIRSIMRSAGYKLRQKISVKIAEPL